MILIFEEGRKKADLNHIKAVEYYFAFKMKYPFFR
jgi:hypothetical protein